MSKGTTRKRVIEITTVGLEQSGEVTQALLTLASHGIFISVVSDRVNTSRHGFIDFDADGSSTFAALYFATRDRAGAA